MKIFLSTNIKMNSYVLALFIMSKCVEMFLLSLGNNCGSLSIRKKIESEQDISMLIVLENIDDTVFITKNSTVPCKG